MAGQDRHDSRWAFTEHEGAVVERTHLRPSLVQQLGGSFASDRGAERCLPHTALC